MKCLIFMIFCALGTSWASQETIDYLAEFLIVKYNVLTNLEDNDDGLPESRGFVDLTNSGIEDVTDNAWAIYFNSVRLWERDILLSNPNDGAPLGNTGLYVYHVAGSLHMIAPAADFGGFVRGRGINAPFTTADWTVSRTDISPNWYVTEEGFEPRLLQSTVGEELEFVADFVEPRQWKRRAFDEYNPYSPEERYELNTGAGITDPLPVIPSPMQYEQEDDDFIDLTEGQWTIVPQTEGAAFAAEYLAEKLENLGINVTIDSTLPDENFIILAEGDVVDNTGSQVDADEAYNVFTSSHSNSANITGTDTAGVFYGVQSFLGLISVIDSRVAVVSITDMPRYPYRGMMVDVSRNFLEAETILRFLEGMAMYKLNKFHFHLTDDEGWRLEIPGLPELTKVGAQRCHDLDRSECVSPQLGSGPFNTTSGSGYYTVEEYREILEYAADRKIEVIPEFDMPGHGHAAILAMEKRYNDLIDLDASRAEEFLLSDLNDTSDYVSIQYFRDNAINPCLDSTYNFVRKLVQEVKVMHEDIQPLQTFHFGGDEVPEGAWEESIECEQYAMDPDQLKEMFVYEVADIVHSEGLALAGWEDGFMGPGDRPYNRSKISSDDVFAFAWNNIWEWGGGSRAYILANQDYNVVLSHATDLYFDMPYEPDPEERGFYWATRFTETRNTFNYMPDRVYDNIEVDLFGRPLVKDEVCDSMGCVPLEDEAEENIVGIQGQLFSETIRDVEQFENMVFPRMLAVAERAWHKASWEDIDNEVTRKQERDENWFRFSNALGRREIRRLDQVGIKYRIPPSGARATADYYLEANNNLPGLPIQVSRDEVTWNLFVPGSRFEPNEKVFVRSVSADFERSSIRTVAVTMPSVLSGVHHSIKQTWKSISHHFSGGAYPYTPVKHTVSHNAPLPHLDSDDAPLYYYAGNGACRKTSTAGLFAAVVAAIFMLL